MTKVLSHLLSISQHKGLLIVIIFSFIFFVTPKVRSTAELQDCMAPFGIRGGKSFERCYYWATSTGIGSPGNEFSVEKNVPRTMSYVSCHREGKSYTRCTRIRRSYKYIVNRAETVQKSWTQIMGLHNYNTAACLFY